MALMVCAGCTRHVRSTESACPFCGAPREASEGADEPVMRTSTRAGVMVGVVVGAVALSSAMLGTACAAYGGPVVRDDAGTDAAATPDGN